MTLLMNTVKIFFLCAIGDRVGHGSGRGARATSSRGRPGEHRKAERRVGLGFANGMSMFE